MKSILQLFKRRKRKLGPAIFYQRTWLSRQVDEAQRKQSIYSAFGIK